MGLFGGGGGVWVWVVRDAEETIMKHCTAGNYSFFFPPVIIYFFGCLMNHLLIF